MKAIVCRKMDYGLFFVPVCYRLIGTGWYGLVFFKALFGRSGISRKSHRVDCCMLLRKKKSVYVIIGIS